MKDYKRLTKRDEEFGIIVMCPACSRNATCKEQGESVACVNEVYDRLADLEDKIEGGLLVELPCKVGDTVYQTDGIRIYQGIINEITLRKGLPIFIADTVCFDERALGLSIFLTKSEVEAKLKELKEIKDE